jgi:phage-related minor tail protein
MTRLKLWAGAVVAALAAIRVAWLAGTLVERNRAKVKLLKDEVKGHEIRNEVENRIAGELDARERLRDRWQR